MATYGQLFILKSGHTASNHLKRSFVSPVISVHLTPCCLLLDLSLLQDVVNVVGRRFRSEGDISDLRLGSVRKQF